MRPARTLAWTVLLLLVPGCGGKPAARVLGGPPARYLVTLDELASPDFTVADPPRAEDAAALARGDASVQRSLRVDGLRSAATTTFSRQADLATSDGPLEVIVTVELFGAAAGAQDAYSRDILGRDASPGEVPVSTGPLGDSGHADSLRATAPGGIEAVEITVEWRLANAVNVVVVRGRYGGARLSDALLLTRGVDANERPPS